VLRLKKKERRMRERDPEDRPAKCGYCAWRSDDGHCAHGDGPRSGQKVAFDELTCHRGKDEYIFMPKVGTPKKRTVALLNICKEYRAWKRKQRTLTEPNRRPHLRIVRDDE